MIIGIDGSNLRQGGGITHLVELLKAAPINDYPAPLKIACWAHQALLDKLPDHPWLSKYTHPFLERSLLHRLYWQRYILPKQAQDCDVFFTPGGGFVGKLTPLVSMCQNMHPFEYKEMARYGLSKMLLRILLLRRLQLATFKRAASVIFLSHYAQDVLHRLLRRPLHAETIIPHGISSAFRKPPRPTRRHFSTEDPFKLLYVSKIDIYKHQWHLLRALDALDSPIPLKLTLIGGYAHPKAARKFKQALAALNNPQLQVECLEELEHHRLPDYYHQADGFIFASSCENFPNILIEAMSAGLPILSSDRGPMPEVLGDHASYFNPCQAPDMTRKIKHFIEDPDRRTQLADAAYQAAQAYSWERCAKSTLDHLIQIAKQSFPANTKEKI